jgi:hypothetical protein
MSTDKNVQTVKDFFAAIGRGDREGLLALVAEDIEWIIPGKEPQAYPSRARVERVPRSSEVRVRIDRKAALLPPIRLFSTLLTIFQAVQQSLGRVRFFRLARPELSCCRS